MNSFGPQQPLGSRRERVRADLCVVGAGFAGLIVAERVAAATGCRVVVLESGASFPDIRITELDRVNDVGGHYAGNLRHRGLGGTSSHWAGKLLPLSPQDMAPRPYLGLDGWPIPAEALTRYLPEIETLLGIAPGGFESDDPALVRGTCLPPVLEEIVWRWPKHPLPDRYRIDRALHGRLATLNNLMIWTDATVTALTMAEGRLAKVHATNHRGGELMVESDQFVLAAGTLETTRLLLTMDSQNDGAISRDTDALGRFVNDHFGADVAILRPHHGRYANRQLADRHLKGTKRHLHGELAATVQRACAVGSAYFDINPRFPPSSAIVMAGRAVDSLKERRVIDAARQLGKAVQGLPSVARALSWKMLRGQQYWPDDTGILIKIWIEQLPRYDNRLWLGSRRDSLGQPILCSEVVLTDDDERTMATMADVLRGFWQRHMAQLGSLEWIMPAQTALIERVGEQAHPAGSTRMGNNPAHSVVNSSLRVHAVPNVQVASASVFPASGSANPTLTILQLAMLAADELITQQRTG